MRTGADIPPGFGLLFRVAFEHAYFPDGLLRGLRIVPVAACHDMLRRAGVLLRPQADGIAAFGDADAMQRLRLHIADTGAPLDMAFQVFFTDPQFFDYTAPHWHPERVLFLDTGCCTTDEGGRQMLHPAPCVPAAALRERADADIVRILGPRVQAPMPAMVLQVAVSHRLLDTEVPTQRSYHVRFDAASTGCTCRAGAPDRRRADVAIAPCDSPMQPAPYVQLPGAMPAGGHAVMPGSLHGGMGRRAGDSRDAADGQ